jgi:hypothetical protein
MVVTYAYYVITLAKWRHTVTFSYYAHFLPIVLDLKRVPLLPYYAKRNAGIMCLSLRPGTNKNGKNTECIHLCTNHFLQWFPRRENVHPVFGPKRALWTDEHVLISSYEQVLIRSCRMSRWACAHEQLWACAHTLIVQNCTRHDFKNLTKSNMLSSSGLKGPYEHMRGQCKSRTACIIV